MMNENMTLKDKIIGDLTAAMKAKDTNRMSALRMVKAALMNEANKKSADYVLTEEEAMKTMQSLVKQRKDSIEQYTNANRADLAEKEQLELAILEEYLPQSATPSEIEIAVAESIGETGASSMKDMGAVMKASQAKLAGKTVDGKLLSETVKTKLQDL
ncbi:MAG: GatB/YqeY domain-containing protein [Pyrinomonadaceae bacterium]